MKIPLYKIFINKKIKKAVFRALVSGKLSRGKEVELFEREFATYIGKKYAIAVNSGTSGLHILVRVFGWGKGDEVITTPFSYIASANSLLFEKVTPVFVDIDPQTLNINEEKIEEKINSKTKGILLVHIFGLPIDYQKIKKLQKKYHLDIIEDACEAIGKPGKDFMVSKLGNATVYGFHENKQLTSGGEGGMIVTNDPILAQKCRAMRDQGRSFKKKWLKKVTLGFNFRMTEMQAAFGREQLKIVEKMLRRRNEIAQEYSRLLKEVMSITTPYQLAAKKRSWFLYFVLFRDSKMRNQVHKTLTAHKIGSSTNYFPPIYNFPMYTECNKDCPVSEDISSRLLALPMFYEMSNGEIKNVVTVIKNSLR